MHHHQIYNAASGYTWSFTMFQDVLYEYCPHAVPKFPVLTYVAWRQHIVTVQLRANNFTTSAAVTMKSSNRQTEASNYEKKLLVLVVDGVNSMKCLYIIADSNVKTLHASTLYSRWHFGG